MSKTALIATLSVCLLAVAVIAVLTVTVISDDGNGGTRVVALHSSPAPGPGDRWPRPGRGPKGARGPNGPQLGPGRVRDCLRKQGLLPLTPGSAPDAKKIEDALKACLGTVPTPQPAPLPGSNGAKGSKKTSFQVG